MLKQKIIGLSLITTALVALAGCGDNSEKDNPNKKQITIGFGVGNYIDQVDKGIVPILEKKGYTVNLRQFSQNRQINPAFEEGSIDASVNQSRAYMEAYNKKNNINMVALTDSPSAPQSLRSNKHKTLDDVKDISEKNIKPPEIHIHEFPGAVKLYSNILCSLIKQIYVSQLLPHVQPVQKS